VCTLALGIGATAAVFSFVDHILFRPLPYADADHLVSVGIVQSLEGQEFMLGGFYYSWRDQQTPFVQISAQGALPHACVLLEGSASQLDCAVVQAGFLPLLGVSPLLGRNFLPAEDRPGGGRVALISYELWTSRYGRSPAVLGRVADLDGDRTRIVGVLPRGFELPTLQHADVLLPMALNEGAERIANPGHPMRAFARLRPGVSIAQARDQLAPLFLRTRDTLIPPAIRSDFHLSVRSLRDRETRQMQRAAWILLGCALAVLLIACANVTGLMVARGLDRAGEMAVRTALGATRSRLVQQQLTEALLLALAGGVAGVLVARLLLGAFLRLAPEGIVFLDRATLDSRILLFTLLLSLGCGLFFGILPALRQPRAPGLVRSRSHAGQRAAGRRLLVIAQIAASMVLVSAALFFLRSFRNVTEQPLGVTDHHVLTARVVLPSSSYGGGQSRMSFYLRLRQATLRLPGVVAAAFSDSVPPGGWQDGRRYSQLRVASMPPPSSMEAGTIVVRGVTPGYFEALNIPILRGRRFLADDSTSTQPLAILSRSLALRLFGQDDPLNMRIQSAEDGPWETIVGVAADVKNGGLDAASSPELYVLRRNRPQDWGGRAPVGEQMSGAAPILLVRSALPDSTVAAWIRSQVAQIDRSVPVTITPLHQQILHMADRSRFETALLGFFAGCGLLMAAIGLYGVVAFLSSQRTLEIGIRIALGSGRGRLLLLLSREGMVLMLTGLALGGVAARLLCRLLAALLYNVQPDRTRTYVAAAALLGAVAATALLLPLLSAVRRDPVEALRHE
jgi:predicted permease